MASAQPLASSSSTSSYVAIADIAGNVASVRKAFETGVTLPKSFRKQQLRQLHKMMAENATMFTDALKKDLRKAEPESLAMEINVVRFEAAEALNKLDSWMAPRKPSVPMVNAMDGCQIRSDPLGVVLIIGPWNYPVNLMLSPLVGAIAAGNCAVLKPSEVSVNTSAVLAELVPKYLDAKCYTVMMGAVAETQEILKQRFDHILYTGGAAVGKVVARAAAEYLTPITLELGGKSPVIIEEGANVKEAARRITWGRFLNCGQTCIAPDYVLCSKDTEAILIPAIAATLKEFYGEDIKQSPDFARVINGRHFNRLKALIPPTNGERGTIALGGNMDESDNYIEPTVLVDVTEDSPAMKEEIFGPILPVLTMDSLDGAIDFINKRDKPLALYMFSKSKASIERVLTETSSGGAVINDTLMHAAVPALPFGGVGMSGMGAYHGKHSFDLFSHKKAVMVKAQGLEFANKIRYPPYTEKTAPQLEMLIGVQPKEGICVVS